ncbi:hypothetical protein GSI_14317 [Ganoderma sinense ZZ0214-1]|uniref:Uncharacterized protein n=1 Tax=Ganoderma sinense ZZ0214-1 TaxID=1077348 RepID=A0A2G8RNE0_9APHY|nr:hypothetical protein GSI_14317 [Ganoderma sinense ZZ0214-1]
MNPSAYSSSVHTTDDISSYTSAGACYDPTQPYSSYADYYSGLYEDHSSSAEEWYASLGPCSDADRALFEAFLTAEVTSTSPSDPCAAVPTHSPSSFESAPSFVPHAAEAPQLHNKLFDGYQLYPHETSPFQPTVPPTFEQTFPDTTASRISPVMRSPFHYAPDISEGWANAATSDPSNIGLQMGHRKPSSYPYPSLPPEPPSQMPSLAIATERRVAARTSHFPTPLALEQSLPEMAVTSISPALIYPSAHSGYDLEGDHSTDVSSLSSRTSRRASSRGPSSPAPYPTPSPEPSPRTSSTVFASQRRNAPARTAAPVSSNTWQCPHCPYVQRNRRSPDLKRHIKTHTRETEIADWVCCGVPVLDAIVLGVPAATVREARAFDFDGTLMLGGCRKAFSRRDALKRHLQREKGKCFGDAQSLHQRGNRDISS